MTATINKFISPVNALCLLISAQASGPALREALRVDPGHLKRHSNFSQWLDLNSSLLDGDAREALHDLALDIAESVGAGTTYARQYTFIAGEKVELPWKRESVPQ